MRQHLMNGKDADGLRISVAKSGELQRQIVEKCTKPGVMWPELQNSGSIFG